MAQKVSFDAYMGWVNITNPNQIPADARVIGANDLLRYEKLGKDTAAKFAEVDTTLDGLKSDTVISDLIADAGSETRYAVDSMVKDGVAKFQKVIDDVPVKVEAQVTPLVAKAIAADSTVANAAAAAVTEKIAGLSLPEQVRADESAGAVGGFVDDQNRVTWLTHTASGGPTDYSLSRLGISKAETLEASGGFLDSDGKATWLTHDHTGGPTSYAVQRIKAALGTIITPPAATPAASLASYRHAMLENDLRMANGGTIRTNGAVPVVMVFDHGLNNFRDIILPLLVARGLPSVMAINSDLHKPGYNIEWESSNVTWEEMDGAGWNSVEISNHGASHTNNAVPEERLEAEIIGSLNELKARLPNKKILTWTQPAIDFPGFNNGTTTANWIDTTAGRMIYEHHAVATGQIRTPEGSFGTYVPKDGNIYQGMMGMWMDTAGSTAEVKTRITAAYALGRGVMLRNHPRVMDTEGKLQTAELISLLDFLKTEQDAKRVRVLNLSQWSIADTGK